MFLNRLENVYKHMELEGLNQAVISDSNAIFYLYGTFLHVGERMIALYLRRGEQPILVLNDLFSINTSKTCLYFNILIYGNFLCILSNTVDLPNPKTVAVSLIEAWEPIM